MKNSIITGIILGLLCLPFSVLATPQAEVWSYWNKSDEGNYSDINHESWDKLLKQYVVTNHPSGINRFDYENVTSADTKKLKKYIRSLSKLDPREYNKSVQKAYWLNLYNALTVRLVLDHYPVSSITKIPGKKDISFGPWDKVLIKVAGKKLSLNDIEHRILRPIWQDYRIHFALNSASLGSPQILSSAFTQRNTKVLLKQAGKDFINHPRGVYLEKGELRVSSIFDWYQQDFARDEKMLTKVFAHYANDRLALYLLGFKGDIEYEHDWALNAP